MTEEAFEKHDLPSGGWVAFRDPKQLTRRQRKPIDRAQVRIGIAKNLQNAVSGEGSAGEVADADIDLLEGLMNACAVSLISDWSFEQEVSETALEDLHSKDYDAVIKAAQVHRPILLPDFDAGPKEDEAGNERPTGLSPDSKIISEGERLQDDSLLPSSTPGDS